MVASVSAKMMRMVADATRRTNSERVLIAARHVCDNQARDVYLSKVCEASCVRARPAPRLRWDRGRCRQGFEPGIFAVPRDVHGVVGPLQPQLDIGGDTWFVFYNEDTQDSVNLYDGESLSVDFDRVPSSRCREDFDFVYPYSIFTIQFDFYHLAGNDRSRRRENFRERPNPALFPGIQRAVLGVLAILVLSGGGRGEEKYSAQQREKQWNP